MLPVCSRLCLSSLIYIADWNLTWICHLSGIYFLTSYHDAIEAINQEISKKEKKKQNKNSVMLSFETKFPHTLADESDNVLFKDCISRVSTMLLSAVYYFWGTQIRFIMLPFH